MPRWGPDADDRLYRAAMELILERGYEAVTVADIAEHAGLKKRSFFRYFPDKREVLFAGAADFEHAVVQAVRQAPATASPVEVVMSALGDAGTVLTEWGEPVRRRQQMVQASPELRERELIKLATLTVAVAGALRERGVEELTATLVAQLGVAVFETAFQQWSEQQPPQPLDVTMSAALARLRSEICGPAC